VSGGSYEPCFAPAEDLLDREQIFDSVAKGHGVAHIRRKANDSYRERSRWEHLREPTARWVFYCRCVGREPTARPDREPMADRPARCLRSLKDGRPIGLSASGTSRSRSIVRSRALTIVLDLLGCKARMDEDFVAAA
jgi:hypothetical protein